MGIVTWISHRAEINNAVQEAKNRALEIMGGKAETYAKQLAPVDTGRLRNSITHQQYNKDTEIIGTNAEYGKKGELSTGSLDTVDKLAHAVKNLDKIIEAEDEGSSGYYPYMRSYNDRSYRGSYRRGARRDSMGRYSGERGYSRNDLADKMRELMEDAPDDRTREEMRRMVDKLENA